MYKSPRAQPQRSGAKVAISQNRAVMQLVPCGDVGEGSDGYRLSVRDAAPGPHPSVKRTKQSQGGLAHRTELVNQTQQRQAVEVCILDVWILIETLDRRLIVAANSERP